MLPIKLLIPSLIIAYHSLVFAAKAPNASVKALYLFPNGTAGENLLVRNDNSILMTMIYPSALLYYFPRPNGKPVLVHNFTGSAAAYGITEYALDQFVILTGTFSRFGNEKALGYVWHVNLTDFKVHNGIVHRPAAVSQLTSFHVGFFNGAVTLNRNTILAADSKEGVVFGIDTRFGNHSVLLNDTSLAPNVTVATGTARLGVNGLARVNDTLYFTNTNKRSVGIVNITRDGKAAGPFKILANNVLVDDLDVDPVTGAVFIASLVKNAVTYVSAFGKSSIIAGSLNSTDVPGPTAIKFAKCGSHLSRLYISTSGGIEYPINGTYIQGGGLYELDLHV